MVKLLLWFFFCNLCPNFTFISCLVVITGSERKSFQSGGNALFVVTRRKGQSVPHPHELWTTLLSKVAVPTHFGSPFQNTHSGHHFCLLLGP